MNRLRDYIKLIGCLIVIILFVWFMHMGIDIHLSSIPVLHTIREKHVNVSALFYTESDASIQSERKLKKH